MHSNHPLFRLVGRQWAQKKGREAQRKGRETEDKVSKAFAEPGIVLPQWLRNVYAAPTNYDFDKGVDFIAKTDVGDVYIQTKSSAYYAAEFLLEQRLRHYNRYIAVVVIEHDIVENNAIRGRVIAAVSKKRKEIFILRNQESYEQAAS